LSTGIQADFVGPGTAALPGMEWMKVGKRLAASGGLEINIHNLRIAYRVSRRFCSMGRQLAGPAALLTVSAQ